MIAIKPGCLSVCLLIMAVCVELKVLPLSSNSVVNNSVFCYIILYILCKLGQPVAGFSYLVMRKHTHACIYKKHHFWLAPL